MCVSILFSTFYVANSRAQEIPKSEIISLQEELAEEIKETSATQKRRACKSIIRKGNSLIEAAPTAPNRFQILSILLQSHRRLLVMDNTDKNRESLYENCALLAKAPDAYADLRLEADLILLEKEQSEKNATVDQRAQALADLVKRYRNTSGEAKSLMMGALIAPKLDAFALEKYLIKSLNERFQSDHEVIEFRKKNLNASLLDVVFSGTYKAADGTSIVFPMDRLGHTSLLYFWSNETSDLALRFSEVKAIQAQFPHQFTVYSFNLNELPDAGEKILREHDLDWKALHFPLGKMNPVFKNYIDSDPGALLVNAQGHSLITSSPMHNGSLPLIPSNQSKEAREKLGFVDKVTTETNFPTLDVSLDHPRFLSQIQSLFIGDFLVADKPQASQTIPAATLDAIHACFTPAPHRYLLSQEQALTQYTIAEKLCQAAITSHPDSSDLWSIRNSRIIALLGMWNLATDPKHLEAAVQEAQTTLAMSLPPAANIVAQFCLAKNKLRNGESPTAVLDAFIESTGGNDPPPTAIAAAALLSMDANERDYHAKFRTALLEKSNDNPALWPVFSFLRDRHHTFRAFHATHSRFGFTRAERHAHYRNIAALDEPADTSRIIKADLSTLDGKAISLPQATDNKITFVAFLELPADEESEKVQDSHIKRITTFVDAHQPKGIKLIAVFLNDEAEKIKALVKKNEWTCEIAMLPKGLNNPLVSQLGILSTDLTPNIFLLRPDGSISWSVSGLRYPVQGNGLQSAISGGMEAQLDVLQMEIAKQALDKGEFETAVKLFSEALAPKNLKGDWWGTFRHYSRARAYVGLRNWDSALADMDRAFEAHQAFGWGKEHRCELIKEMELYKADILDQLGKKAEAETLRAKAAEQCTPHNESPFGIYIENRENFRLNPHQGK